MAPSNRVNSPFQQTLARSVECVGIGLHGGSPVRVVLRPSSDGRGIVFRRMDLEKELKARRDAQDGNCSDRVEILASVENVCEVDHATTLAADTPVGRAVVGTVEHLLSALVGLGIDSCSIELDAAEVPILDGSAGPWVELIRNAGVRSLRHPRQIRRLVEPLAVSAGNSSIVAYPCDGLKLTCAIDFAHPAIGQQERSVTLTPDAFVAEVASARTFGFLREVVALQAKGLVKGGSLENAIVLDDDSVVNGNLRFADEFVRHKLLDLLGDLELAGMPLRAHVVARRAGHRLHVEFLRELLANPKLWTVETAQAAEARVAAMATRPTMLSRDARLAPLTRVE